MGDGLSFGKYREGHTWTLHGVPSYFWFLWQCKVLNHHLKYIVSKSYLCVMLFFFFFTFWKKLIKASVFSDHYFSFWTPVLQPHNTLTNNNNANIYIFLFGPLVKGGCETVCLQSLTRFGPLWCHKGLTSEDWECLSVGFLESTSKSSKRLFSVMRSSLPGWRHGLVLRYNGKGNFAGYWGLKRANKKAFSQ